MVEGPPLAADLADGEIDGRAPRGWSRLAGDWWMASSVRDGRVFGIGSHIGVIGPSVPDNVSGLGPLDDG